MLLWYALEGKGGKHNFELESFSFNFYSLGSILEQAKSVRLPSPRLTVLYKGRTLTDYNEAIRLNPNYADAYYNRANRYKQLGEKQKALADYRESARIYQQQGKITDYEDAQNRIKELGLLIRVKRYIKK